MHGDEESGLIINGIQVNRNSSTSKKIGFEETAL
jgi:hypothetical protein